MPFWAPADCGWREFETDHTTVFTPRIIVLSICFTSLLSVFLSPLPSLSPPLSLSTAFAFSSTAIAAGSASALESVIAATTAGAGAPPSPLAASASSISFLRASICLAIWPLNVANLHTRQCRMRTSSARPSASFLWKMFSTKLSSSRTEVVWIPMGSDESWMLHEKM